MKKYLSFIPLLVLVTLCTNCDDYTDLDPTEQTSETFFTTEEDYQKAVVGVYDLLATTYLTQILGEIASDNSLCGGENASDVLDWQQIDDMSHNPDNGALRSIFQWMYAGISRAAYILEFQDNLDFAGKERLIAETKVLQCFYYFQLVKYFGDVPYYADRRITLEETQTIDRMPKAEVYANLETKLLEAIPDLPLAASEPGRITRGAAQAILGKIYLYQEKFSEAADMLDQVIQSGQYDLVDDFSELFALDNENNEESIFEVQYNGNIEGASFGCLQCVEGNVAVGFMGPRFRGGDFSPFTSGFSFNVPVESLYNSYTQDDVRRDYTIFDINAFVAERPDVTFNEGFEHTGYFNRKYIPFQEPVIPDQNINHSNNYRAIRFADVLLMAAEAYSRGGLGDTQAQIYLNQVRNRAGLNNITATGTALTEAIWNERRLELAGEGHRFFDQVRTGQTSTIPGFTTNKNEVFPIPRIEIELAGNRWPQNPGY